MIKHVSFDVWNTIVAPNREFAEQRTRLLARALGREAAFVASAYTRVKQEVDAAAEREGIACTTADVYARLFAACGAELSPARARAIRLDVEQQFHGHPPRIPAAVIELMQRLTERGIATSIASNSNFVSGEVMHPFLAAALQHEFAFGVYSDQIGHAKPSPAFFAQVCAPLLAANPSLARDEILHVGDHPVCDVQGARAAGLHALLIESPERLAEQVLRRLDAGESTEVR